MDELYARSRRSLLDALEALAEHRKGVILIGAHAVYLYTGEADVPVATRTKDSDLALDPALLRADPLLEEAMASADFHRNLESGQPGEWLSADGIPVDLLAPSSLVDPGGAPRRTNSSPFQPGGPEGERPRGCRRGQQGTLDRGARPR